MPIVQLDIKACPFRKETYTIDPKGLFLDRYITADSHAKEDFLPCIEEKCMAWSKAEKCCLMMRKEEKK